MRRRGWGIATAVTVIAVMSWEVPALAMAAGQARQAGPSSSVRVLRIYYQSPVLVRAGERVSMPVQVVCATATGKACDASISLGIRAGNGDVWRFRRVEARPGLTFDLSAPAARAASSAGAQSVDFAFQADADGVDTVLPASGLAPLKFYATRRIQTLRVPAVPFGRVKQGRTVVSLPWGSGPRRVGLELGREAPTLGPPAFDVDRAGHVILLDALQGRVAEFEGARLLRQWPVHADPSSDVAVAGDDTTYVSQEVRGELSVSRRTRSGRGLGTVSLGPAMLSQLRAGVSSAFAELLPLDAWVRIAGRGPESELAPIAGRPVSSGGRLLRVGTERYVRLGVVRAERVESAVELRSSYRFGEVALAEPDGSGGYVVVVRMWTPSPPMDQFQVIHVSKGRVAETFAASSRSFAASLPLSRFRLGRDGRLYQMVSEPRGVRIVRFEMKGES